VTGSELRDRVVVWSYRAMERFVMRAPEPLGRAVGHAVAQVAYRALPRVRDVVAANQARVIGRPASDPLVRAATQECFELYARYWYDTFHARVMPHDEVLRRTTFRDVKHIDEALEAGRGCIAVVPHMGNWDVGGHWLAISGYRVASVAEELRPREIFEQFLRHREALGIRIIPLLDGTHVGQQLAGLLRDNWLVALVADRDLSGRGVEVEMFGAPRRLPAGPALLSLSTGAPLLVCPTWTMPEGWLVQVGAAVEIERTGRMKDDVVALTQRMGEEFERAIAARPPDWHLFQPAWPSG
jgi:phosphatidylinositol dimannoside acyltransferase